MIDRLLNIRVLRKALVNKEWFESQYADPFRTKTKEVRVARVDLKSRKIIKNQLTLGLALGRIPVDKKGVKGWIRNIPMHGLTNSSCFQRSIGQIIRNSAEKREWKKYNEKLSPQREKDKREIKSLVDPMKNTEKSSTDNESSHTEERRKFDQKEEGREVTKPTLDAKPQTDEQIPNTE